MNSSYTCTRRWNEVDQSKTAFYSMNNLDYLQYFIDTISTGYRIMKSLSVSDKLKIMIISLMFLIL